MVLDVRDIQRDVDKWYNRMLSRFDWPGGMFSLDDGLRMPLMDLQELENEYVAALDVPGIARGDVHVRQRNHGIEIEARQSREQELPAQDVFRFERSAQGYYRYFSLPNNAMPEQASAQLKDGVLTITIPKGEAADEDSREIEVK